MDRSVVVPNLLNLSAVVVCLTWGLVVWQRWHILISDLASSRIRAYILVFVVIGTVVIGTSNLFLSRLIEFDSRRWWKIHFGQTGLLYVLLTVAVAGVLFNPITKYGADGGQLSIWALTGLLVMTLAVNALCLWLRSRRFFLASNSVVRARSPKTTES